MTVIYDYDEYFGPRFNVLTAYAARVNAGESEMTEHDIIELGRAVTEIEEVIDSVNRETPEDTARLRQQLRDLVASTRTHMDNDHKHRGLDIPDDLSGLLE